MALLSEAVPQGEIVLYETSDRRVALEVRSDSETVWLKRQQMAQLFGRDVKTIGKHIANALREELAGFATVAKFATVQTEGGRQVERQVEHYNLDTILPVGYRVNSSEGIQTEFRQKGEASDLFGQLRGNGLASALATIEQGFGNTLFYANVATRAAHLLYFIIKSHPFVDDNKRIGSFLFLCYLRLNQHLLARLAENLINDNTLVALTLLVAESPPEQKDPMTHLIEHFVLLRTGEP